MRAVAVLPVKRFADAKQRLSTGLAPGTRRALAEAMLTDVLVALRRTEGLDEVVVVTAEPVAEALALGYGARVVSDTREAGQSPAAQLGLDAVEGGGRRAARPRRLPGTRSRPAHRTAAVGRAGALVVLVPDRHGTGTNGLVLHPPTAIEPSFGPGSRERHTALRRGGGASLRVEEMPSLVLDVDTPDDLAAMREVLERSRGGAAHTRGLLRRLARNDEAK